MNKQAETNNSCIAKLVAHNDGPVAMHRLLGAAVSYQAVQNWVRQGFAPPKHIAALAAFMPPGMTADDLTREMLEAKGRRPDPTEIAGATPPRTESETDTADSRSAKQVPADVLFSLLMSAANDSRLSDAAFREFARRNLR